MTEPVRSLPLSDRDAQTIFRALLEYDKILSWSLIKDSELVRPELLRARELQTKISLTSFYPEEDFPQDYD
jgi:hypothetical protein